MEISRLDHLVLTVKGIEKTTSFAIFFRDRRYRQKAVLLMGAVNQDSAGESISHCKF
jgi:hypothetical protein